jgi:hypothetical protein
MSLQSGKLPFLGSEDEFFNHTELFPLNCGWWVSLRTVPHCGGSGKWNVVSRFRPITGLVSPGPARGPSPRDKPDYHALNQPPRCIANDRWILSE